MELPSSSLRGERVDRRDSMNDSDTLRDEGGSCSHCGRGRAEGARLIRAPAALVCERCLARLPEWFPPEERRKLRGVNFTGDLEHLARPWRLPRPESCDLVIFQHVPKSGGTTIDFVLSAVAERCGRGYRRFGVSRTFIQPVWIVPGWTGAWDTVGEHARNGETTSGFGICSGHFPYGVHRLLGRPARYVTLVRDPLAREISSYNYHHQNGSLADSDSLEDLLSQGRLLDNPQTRMLAGPAAMRGPCTEDTFHQAIANLELDFALVGVTERAHEFLGALLGLLGFPAVQYVHSRVTAIRRIESPDPRLGELLGRIHAWDVRLHRRCEERWRTFEERHRDSIPESSSPTDDSEIVVVSGARRVQDSPTRPYPTAGTREDA
jgi:hypothetical protein